MSASRWSLRSSPPRWVEHTAAGLVLVTVGLEYWIARGADRWPSSHPFSGVALVLLALSLVLPRNRSPRRAWARWLALVGCVVSATLWVFANHST